MDRRTFIGSVLGLIGAPCLAHAQAPRPTGKIGFLSPVPTLTDPTLSLLRPAWQRLGYVEGETMLLRSTATRSACRNSSQNSSPSRSEC